MTNHQRQFLTPFLSLEVHYTSSSRHGIVYGPQGREQFFEGIKIICLRADTTLSRYAEREAVYYIKLLHHRICLVQGPENIAALWKYRSDITTSAHQTFVLKTVLGMDPKAVSMYEQDDTGTGMDPNPGARPIAPQNRIDHITHTGFHKLLISQGLPKLFERWVASFDHRRRRLDIRNQWTSQGDMLEFWTLPLTAALNEALAGPLLEIINPNFNKQFVEFLWTAPIMMRGLPECLLPSLFSLRDKLVASVEQWQAVARAKFTVTDTEANGKADPWWGSDFFQERQKLLLEVDNWDEKAVAVSDFGFLWG